ncbi:uncharacterized protein BT62DRAFT_920203 [Guyanagaster necrorhizus]|uniref:Uncharacterized protein n=1 Tax=Guyanagaster necrorhizus TaxID=856835 RepID=A0A9P7VU93_9AGAR|nr:uncharacterized protein BT62DRAFT_920203 [Guyanagaster necrorhizus MCA 3950]KAG7446189.1 hypothetical protein BT62DRAFT_920203 [Guyanagaster necrorhizus MCA 3950]
MLALRPGKIRTSQIIFKECQSAIEFHSSLSAPHSPNCLPPIAKSPSSRRQEGTLTKDRRPREAVRGKTRVHTTLQKNNPLTKDQAPPPTTNLVHSHPIPYELPDPRATADLPTAGDEFPYDKFTRSGETLVKLPTGSATPFTDAIFPRTFILWNHITAGFPEDIHDAIATFPEKFIAAVPFGAGPKFYAENRRADLLLNTFLEVLDFPDKGKLTVFFPIEAKEDKKDRNKDEGRRRKSAFDKPWPLIITDFSENFAKFLLCNQCFATASHAVWNLIPFNPKALASTITAFQGNVVSNDPDLIAEALACIKAATWCDVSIQSLVKRITQTQGRLGNPAELTVKMTRSWRLSYMETKNFEDDKGPVFLLTRERITDDLDMHRLLAAHIRQLKLRVNYQ